MAVLGFRVYRSYAAPYRAFSPEFRRRSPVDADAPLCDDTALERADGRADGRSSFLGHRQPFWGHSANGSERHSHGWHGRRSMRHYTRIGSITLTWYWRDADQHVSRWGLDISGPKFDITLVYFSYWK